MRNRTVAGRFNGFQITGTHPKTTLTVPVPYPLPLFRCKILIPNKGVAKVLQSRWL